MDVAVGAARANAASHARPVRYESCRIEPRAHLVRPGSGGANAAAMVVEHGVHAGNSIRALCVGAVKAIVGPCGCREHPAAGQNENRRDRPAIDQCLDDVIVAVEVVDVPCAGHRGAVAMVCVHRAVFLPNSAAEGAQRVVAGCEGSAQVAGILRVRNSIFRPFEAIERVAPHIVSADAEAAGKLLRGRDLQGVVTACQVRQQIGDRCSQHAGAAVDSGRASGTISDTGIELTPLGGAYFAGASASLVGRSRAGRPQNG